MKTTTPIAAMQYGFMLYNVLIPTPVPWEKVSASESVRGGQFWDVWNVSASAINERTSGERSLSFYEGGAVFVRSKSRYEDHIGHLDAVFLFSAVFNKT